MSKKYILGSGLFEYYVALDPNLEVIAAGPTPEATRDLAILNGCDAPLVVHRSKYIPAKGEE